MLPWLIGQQGEVSKEHADDGLRREGRKCSGLSCSQAAFWIYSPVNPNTRPLPTDLFPSECCQGSSPPEVYSTVSQVGPSPHSRHPHRVAGRRLCLRLEGFGFRTSSKKPNPTDVDRCGHGFPREVRVNDTWSSTFQHAKHFPT